MSKPLRIPKPRRIPNVFNKEQLLALFKAIEEPDVMMAVLIGTFCGLRLGEVCKLRKMDIDFEKKILKVVNGKLAGKTLSGYGKDRVVPIPTRIIPVLRMWSELREGEFLFESITKTHEPMTTAHLFRKYKTTLVKAKLSYIDKKNAAGNSIARYNFHTLRHTYATMLWEKTGDIYAVKQALGHSDLDITMIYTHVSDKALQNKVNNAFDAPYPIKENKIELNQIKNNAQIELPLEILKTRLAKGEIALEEFKQLKNEL